MPRRPHETVLYELVREHYESFLAYTQATYRAPLPNYVTDAFERYLACGDFSRGFIRCRCDACAHDVLLPFSCKQRSLCPSCGTRRMCGEAATVTDRIFPSVPIRQWVMSLPFELRGLAALKPDVLTAMGRIFAEEIARTTKRLAGVGGAETGAVSFPQRFGGSLNLHVHFHTLEVDGVFEEHDGGVRFHDAPAPGKDDLEDLVRRVHDRAVVWLGRHRYLDERPAEERGHDTRQQEPIDAFAALALAGGTFTARPFAPDSAPGDAAFEKKERRFSVSYQGFDIHCAVRVDRDDDEGRERLVRYCARPPFALDRIEVLKDGRIAYRMKTPRRGSTHRVMTPMEFMARLAILVAPPYFPLTRYHGVFAARSSWRPLVTPKPPPGSIVPRKKHKSCKPCKEWDEARRPEPPASARPVPPPTSASARPTAAPSVAAPPLHDDPTHITVKHWRRILDGALYAASSRLDWATLLRRTHGIDALVCPECDGRLRPIATITDPGVAQQILLRLGVCVAPPPRARARDPSGQETFDFDAA